MVVLINVTCLEPRDRVLFIEVSVFQGVRISRFNCTHTFDSDINLILTSKSKTSLSRK